MRKGLVFLLIATMFVFVVFRQIEAQMPNTTIVMKTGNGTAADVQRVTIANNSTGTVGLNAGTNAIGTVGLDTGTNSVGTVGLNTGTNSIGTVQPGNTQNTTPWIVTAGPDTVGTVATSTALTSTLGATVFAIKATAGNLYGYSLFNAHTAVCYIQVFDIAAASVNLGTTVPKLAIPVSTVNDAHLMGTLALLNSGTALSAASTTTATGSTTCTTATVANFFYK